MHRRAVRMPFYRGAPGSCWAASTVRCRSAVASRVAAQAAGEGEGVGAFVVEHGELVPDGLPQQGQGRPEPAGGACAAHGGAQGAHVRMLDTGGAVGRVRTGAFVGRIRTVGGQRAQCGPCGRCG
ncbi:hypothetical protein HS99_0015795 [Kitasatospora aureofaciens]|uniref:Uncharacterized protein n=1 Tax=Kitasatospora aureofaciens TaxID=1894 RepID=A0A1E7MWB8_KITAU|nr:hypothetical protein HS99_0015795 [Kitasatospora aureofaciens]